MSSLSWAVSDSLVMTRRHLIQIPRIPELLFFTIFQPIMFIVLFAVVFGKAIPVPGDDYISFMMPGIFVQTMAFATAGTSVGLAEDLHKGLVDRFRSLPMSRSAVLVGRLLADTVRNTLVLVIMIVVGLIVGFRFSNGLLPALGGTLLLIGFAFAFSAIGAFVGLAVSSTEAAQMAGMVWIFPLTFASNAFVPLDKLPGWLQAITQYSPVTVTINALRGMFFGGPIAVPLLQSIVWTVAISAVALFFAVRKYKKVSTH